MGRMQRTQIYLEPEKAKALDRIARRKGMSRAEVIRLAADRLIREEEAPGEDPLLRLIGIAGNELAEGGAVPAERVAEEHDVALAEEHLEYDAGR